MAVVRQEDRDLLPDEVLDVAPVHGCECRVDGGDLQCHRVRHADGAPGAQEGLLPLAAQRIGGLPVANVTGDRMDLGHRARVGVSQLAHRALDEHRASVLVDQAVAHRGDVRAVEDLLVHRGEVRHVVGVEEVVGGSSHELPRRIAEEPDRGRRGIAADAIGSEPRDHVGGFLGEGAELALTGGQRLFGAPLLRHVACDSHGPHHAAVLVAYGRQLGAVDPSLVR